VHKPFVTALLHSFTGFSPFEIRPFINDFNAYFKRYLKSLFSLPRTRKTSFFEFADPSRAADGSLETFFFPFTVAGHRPSLLPFSVISTGFFLKIELQVHDVLPFNSSASQTFRKRMEGPPFFRAHLRRTTLCRAANWANWIVLFSALALFPSPGFLFSNI